MKGVLLISDGIDSPVAGYLMHARGLDITGLHFVNSRDFGVKKKVKKLLKIVQKNAQLKTLDHVEIQEKIKENCNTRYQCVLCKRSMLARAEQVANEIGADFLITGDNLGQVASQTIENMFVLDSAVKIPVIRPLLGFDKSEIVKIARKIGTYGISIDDAKECAFLPHNPAIKTKLDNVIREEAKIG